MFRDPTAGPALPELTTRQDDSWCEVPWKRGVSVQEERAETDGHGTRARGEVRSLQRPPLGGGDWLIALGNLHQVHTGIDSLPPTGGNAAADCALREPGVPSLGHGDQAPLSRRDLGETGRLKMVTGHAARPASHGCVRLSDVDDCRMLRVLAPWGQEPLTAENKVSATIDRLGGRNLVLGG